MSDLSMKMIISIGSSLLMVAAFLIAVVASFLFKVSEVLKDVQEPDAEADCAINTKDKVIFTDSIFTESCPIIQLCEECKMYADPLPPCFCEINSGC